MVMYQTTPKVSQALHGKKYNMKKHYDKAFLCPCH